MKQTSGMTNSKSMMNTHMSDCDRAAEENKIHRAAG